MGTDDCEKHRDVRKVERYNGAKRGIARIIYARN